MNQIVKNFTASKDIKEFYKNTINWCQANDIVVTDSKIETDNFKILTTKSYEPLIKFSWGAVLGLFFLGMFMSMAGGGGDDKATRQVMMLFPMAIYVVYYFVKKKNKSIDMVFIGSAHGGDVDVTIKMSESYVPAHSDIAQYIAKYS